MMKIKFKPLPGLTIVTLICLAILLYLGTWQYQRLQWKTQLLAEVEEASIAAPFTSLAQISEQLALGSPVDFRKISLSGDFITPSFNDGEPFHFLRSSGKALTWRLYQLYDDGAQQAYVATIEYAEARTSNPPRSITGPQQVVGYVRLVRPPSRFPLKSTPEKNRWFVFNAAPDVLDWAGPAGAIETRYYIDWVTDAKTAKDLPIRKPDIRNNHLDYMLTWYSFALILLVIYFLLHKKQGRLSFGRGAS